MNRILMLIHSTILLLISVANFSISAENQLIGARYPAISPDGKQIAFSYMGDLWLVPVEGGRAIRLTDHVAYEREPVWSTDSKWLAFSSDRNGNNDVFLMKATGGIPKQITYHSSEDIATDFTPDGEWIIFRSKRSSLSSIFKIHINGGNAVPLLDTYWNWPFHAKISPDGKNLLFSLGMENGSWWRRGYRGSNSAKIWIKPLSDNSAKQIVADESNCYWSDWDAEGNNIYFISDKQFNNKNIWNANIDGANLSPVTKFEEKDINWLSIAGKVPKAVYERDFGIWITDLQTGESHPIQIEAPAETKDNRIFFVENASVSEYRLSPDGLKIAAIVRGDIFVLSTEGGYARNITNTPWREHDIDWDKDSKKLVYVSDADANPDLYIVSALGDEVSKHLTQSEEDEQQPRFSPDGKWITYYSGKRQIRLIEPDGKNDKLLIEDNFGGRFGDDFAWSPDSRFLAIVPQRHGNTDIFAINIESREKILLTNTAYDENNPLWSPDGKFMIFSSNRFGHSFPEFTGKLDLYQLYLEPEKTEFDEDKFEKLFREEKKEDEKKEDSKDKDKDKKEQKPAVEVKFKLDDLDLQTKPVTNTLGNDREYVLSPKDTSTIYFVSDIDGKNHLWTTSLKEKERGKYEPFMPQINNPRHLQFDKKGEYLYYLGNGKIGQIDVSGKDNKIILFDTKIQVDKTADYEQMLGELYYTLQYYFYDPNHHHLNWKQTYQQFLPVLQQVREDQDFYDYANEMIGYLNSSHTGIGRPIGRTTQEPSAHLGVEWNFTHQNITIGKIIKNGPVYFHRDSVSVGDELVAINGEKIDPKQNIWKYLNGKLGKRVKLTIKNHQSRKNIDVSLKPISASAENRLLLEEWIESRRQIVKNKTEDQVAYIYMRAMGYGDLQRFLKELERDAVPRKGLILDLRYNFGGNVHDRVLQALMKPVYAKWRIRGLSETPQSTFGFVDKPIVLLVNEVTLSDGEMTANGFKTLNRGPIIGNTTYGWLIFTTGAGLMNGGYFRLPFWGCYTIDGKDLETNGGVKPDIVVINDLNHELQNQDPQLDRAINQVLQMINQNN